MRKYGKDNDLEKLTQMFETMTDCTLTLSVDVFDVAMRIGKRNLGVEFKNALKNKYQGYKYVRFTRNQHRNQKALADIWNLIAILVVNDEGKLLVCEKYFDIVEQHKTERGQKSPVILLDELKLIPIEKWLKSFST